MPPIAIVAPSLGNVLRSPQTQRLGKGETEARPPSLPATCTHGLPLVLLILQGICGAMQSEYVESLFKSYQELGDGDIGALNQVHDLMKSPIFPHRFEIPHLRCALGACV